MKIYKCLYIYIFRSEINFVKRENENFRKHKVNFFELYLKMHQLILPFLISYKYLIITIYLLKAPL